MSPLATGGSGDRSGGSGLLPVVGPLSLAAGVLPEFEPPEVVSAAAAAGFELVGIWFDPARWSPARARDVRCRLDDSGIAALDMEPIFVTPDGDHGVELIDAAAEVGARNVLSVSRGLEPARFAARFAVLCDHAASAGITVVVEPTMLYSVTTLAEAQHVVALAGRPNAGILADNLHLDRAGGEPIAALRQLDPALLPYAQLCDAPAKPTGISRADLFSDARDGRRLLGEGDLPVRECLAALPAESPCPWRSAPGDSARTTPTPPSGPSAFTPTPSAISRHSRANRMHKVQLVWCFEAADPRPRTDRLHPPVITSDSHTRPAFAIASATSAGSSNLS